MGNVTHHSKCRNSFSQPAGKRSGRWRNREARMPEKEGKKKVKKAKMVDVLSIQEGKNLNLLKSPEELD
jgi:hypothetical protein